MYQIDNSNQLILQPTESKNKYNVTFNEQVVAEVLLDVDGFYYVDLLITTGWWIPQHLKIIADFAIELNRPYEEELKAYFDGLDEDKFINF